MRRWLTGVVVIWLAFGCGDEKPADEVVSQRPLAPMGEAGDVPEVEPVDVVIMSRAWIEDPSPGRIVLHLLVPAGSSTEQIRQSVIRTLNEQGQEDDSIIAIRAVIFAQPEVEGANLAPVGWAEWVPPQGWDAVRRRAGFYRTNIFLGAQPEWK